VSLNMTANYIRRTAKRIKIKCNIFRASFKQNVVWCLVCVGIGESWRLNGMTESCDLSFTCNDRRIDASRKR